MSKAARLERRLSHDGGGAFENLPPLLQRIYRNRGLTSAADVDYRAANLLRPNLKGIGQAAALLADAVEGRHRILIVGDFDADGATGCALALRILAKFGASVDGMMEAWGTLNTSLHAQHPHGHNHI